MSAEFASTDEQYHRHLLRLVSRTFALTIPQLPVALQLSVANAYLLCRIADTIEDEPALTPEEKGSFHADFLQVLEARLETSVLVSKLLPRLTGTIRGEQELIRNMQRVIGLTHRFSPVKKDLLIRCLRVMCTQMSGFQAVSGRTGLKDMAEMNRYCYTVAGVVGEMLTELFCTYSDEVSVRYTKLIRLAPSFGQGLQMTNILKDVWDDFEEGSCWLPEDLFRRTGYDLSLMHPDRDRSGFTEGLLQLLAVCHGHLQNALEYSLMIPARETGIRRFLLCNVNMAAATLGRMHAHPGYLSGKQVKISRTTLISTIAATNAGVRSNGLMRRLFRVMTRGLPLESVSQDFFEQSAGFSSYWHTCTPQPPDPET